MANNIMNIMSVSFNSQAELEDFLNRVKGKDDDGEKDFSLQSVVPMRLLLSRMLMAQRSLLRKILAPAFSLRWMRKAQSDMQISHPHKKCALH